ncbi:EscE/YscE/SsaE family type III secretion system needle protein co-chaperone [Pandoraea sputorum]|uniref:EscE/YscE/SsaE family type III secretion system needle protein co-chaperone n=1 Tax=Pandoraea sputorum TaxID=93222 RepID=UPI001241AB04|nr:EscE/YscE/SsaE family type III secretion system needle protein co-chaperone [Pandoraea sputorum]VVE55786.1 hypothetical protein PSP20601_05012 [Pandoraea sputorum]
MTFLTDLEERLAADRCGDLRRELLSILELELIALGQRQRQQQSAECYAGLERQRVACLAGIRVVERIWRRLNP